MFFYDLIAPAYDPCLRALYRPFRVHAFTHLIEQPGGAALDLACGTGQNFPFLARLVGLHGTIIGIDRSSGMLRRARRNLARQHLEGNFLLNQDARALSPDILERGTRRRTVDLVVCTFGFSAMRDWKIPFHRSYDLLKPGGRYLILDAHAARRTLHVRAVEKFTRSNFSRETWHLLERLSSDFHLEYIDPSTHLFGARAFVAVGTKPFSHR